MVALHTPALELDLPAPDFNLPDPSGKLWSLDSLKGPNGLLVVFMCNHCPFVKAILPELAADLAELKQHHQVNSVAIMSNNYLEYPDDAPEKMQALAEEYQFSFPYLVDESQEVAKAFGAVCTPDFFGYNADLKLQYRGRFDASGRERVQPRAEAELLHAMKQVAETGRGPSEQTPSIGCSIKWKE